VDVVPRIRTLKPEALQHRKVGRLSDRAFRLWITMLTQADDHGRLVADPNQLRLLAFGYHDKVHVQHVEAALEEIARWGLIRCYSQNGTQYVDFPSWMEHQKVCHPLESKLPAFSECSEDSRNFKNLLDDSILARARGSDQGSDQGSRIKDQGVGLRPTAQKILEFLNEKAGKAFRPVAAHLDLIQARLKDGATEANCRGVIARKVREWGPDPKMAKYLRPETLFNRTKFESYLGERGHEEGA
jgi:uncharacterized phage protein (TIGR02220 family)